MKTDKPDTFTKQDRGNLYRVIRARREMALCSTACAIQNLWLAARAENLGMGWVSFFEQGEPGKLLHCPDDTLPIALLCIRPANEFYAEPMLQQEHWRRARPLSDFIYQNRWQDEHD